MTCGRQPSRLSVTIARDQRGDRCKSSSYGLGTNSPVGNSTESSRGEEWEGDRGIA